MCRMRRQRGGHYFLKVTSRLAKNNYPFLHDARFRYYRLLVDFFSAIPLFQTQLINGVKTLLMSSVRGGVFL
jgi:hypothetical protein